MLDGLAPPLLVLGSSALLLVWRMGPWCGRGRRADAGIGLAIVVLALALELAMGRPAAYRNGPFRVWSGSVQSDQNSQQLTDAYTFTHVIHGAAFYGLTRVAMPRSAVAVRTLVALAFESSWEVYENTDRVINRYRSSTISLGYYGDSVTNSLGDILACLLGFALTWRLPTRVTLAWVAVVELALAAAIRDNLTLNIIMLLYPIDAIRVWQLGA
jgi:hypothetical protein